jgi:ribosomal protein L21E
MKSIEARYPREQYQLDLVDVSQFSAHNGRYCYLMNIIDCYTKYAWSIPLQHKTKEQVGHELKRLFLQEGHLAIIQMDDGKEFVNDMFKAICAGFSTSIIKGRPRHPQSQGQIERFNQTLCRAITKTINDKQTKRWLDVLDEVLSTYNRMAHRSTKFAPILLFKGITGLATKRDASTADESISPFTSLNEMHSKALKKLEEYRKNMVLRASIHKKKRTFEVGDAVLVKMDFDTNQKTKKTKFNPFYRQGRSTIIKICGNNSYTVSINE